MQFITLVFAYIYGFEEGPGALSRVDFLEALSVFPEPWKIGPFC